MMGGLFAELVRICRQGWGELAVHLPLTAALFGSGLLLLTLLRIGTAFLGQGVRTWRRLGSLPVAPLPTSLEALAARAGLTGRLRLVEAEAPWALCAGLLRPCVWVSRGLVAALDGEELEAVLLHEAHHLRRRDPLRRLAAEALAEALPFWPEADRFRQALRIRLEAEADRAVLERLGRRPLLRALWRLATASSPGGTASAPFSLLEAGEAVLPPLPRPWLPLLILLSSPGVLFVLLFLHRATSAPCPLPG